MRLESYYYGALIAILQACKCRSFGNTIVKGPRRSEDTPADLDYDLVIVGAGASGLFASGAASMLGSKTLLIDTYVDGTPNLGGDCTNAACVPSKALRSMGQSLSATAAGPELINSMESARRHATNVVRTVRARERPESMVDRNPMLDLMLVDKCQFESPNRIVLGLCESYSSARVLPSETKNVTIQSKKFLVATGASPFVPEHLDEAARRAGILTYTYRTLLRPSNGETDPKSSSIWQLHNSNESRRIVIAGGGATACELGQILARLGGRHTTIHLVAPTLLRNEDITLQNAAFQLLAHDGVELHLRNRVEDILEDKQIVLSDGTVLPPADAIVFCLGRKPTSLGTLGLENANVDWSEDLGIITNKHLRSTTAPNVYACGDCCSAVASKPASRTATQGAWTGYHAATNAKIPAILRVGSQSCHPIVPRVVYTDPELSSVGMSLEECTRKFGLDGFNRLSVPEAQTDRADMDSQLRNTNIGFVEIRAAKVTGKILGFTACGPAASEMANEMSLAIQNGLTALDVTRSLHSYPSHGYLMHRVALAIAFSDVWGNLEALGYIGRVAATIGRVVTTRVYSPLKGMRNRKERKILREWEAEGVRQGMVFCTKDNDEREHYPASENARYAGVKVVSFIDVYNRLVSKDASEIAEDCILKTATASEMQAFQDWLSSSSNGRSLLKSIEEIQSPGLADST